MVYVMHGNFSTNLYVNDMTCFVGHELHIYIRLIAVNGVFFETHYFFIQDLKMNGIFFFISCYFMYAH